MIFAILVLAVLLSLIIADLSVARRWSLLASVGVALFVGGVVTLILTLLGVH